ncbi:MAG: sugar nucleotide-binding protein [Bryobacterales bacterium]
MRAPVVILGCGYTARRLRGFEQPPLAFSRSIEGLAEAGFYPVEWDAAAPDAAIRLAREVPQGATVLYSVPTLRLAGGGLEEPAPRLLPALEGRARRLVYISTTGVYGPAHAVDETTPVNPQTERQRLRVAAERAVLAGSWGALVLRSAAIYGPGRGAHTSMRDGRYKLVGDGSGYISRIHVDDLAALVRAALDSDLTGAFPVADAEPCSQLAMAQLVCELTGLPMPGRVSPEQADETRRGDRRVDGRAIRRLLGVELLYPSFREGVPAALAAEA